MNKRSIVLLVIMLFSLVGCQTAKKNILDSNGESQIKKRLMQTRSFDTADKKSTLQAVIATLQDLGFVIDKASFDLGTVSGTKLNGYRVRMSVTVVPRGESQMVVRSSAQYNIVPIEDPILYQDFFNALSKAMFLEANLVE